LQTICLASGIVEPSRARAEPDYLEFLYFSFAIGMTFQVSDVQIENHCLREARSPTACSLSSFDVVATPKPHAAAQFGTRRSA
jgi:uncharacterized membrane protein